MVKKQIDFDPALYKAMEEAVQADRVISSVAGFVRVAVDEKIKRDRGE